MNSKVIDFSTVLLARNHAIFVALSIILVSIAVPSSQTASAKNTTASTLPLTSMQRLPLAASSTPTTRIFNIYSTHVTGFNETKGVQKGNLTSDQYSLQTI